MIPKGKKKAGDLPLPQTKHKKTGEQKITKQLAQHHLNNKAGVTLPLTG